MPELLTPTTDLHDAWLACHREWGPGVHEDGFAINPDDDVESVDGFAAWVARLHALPAARAWWIVEGDEVRGGIVLRHVTSETTQRLGHVGYGIRPSARGRGLATWVLGRVRSHGRAAGLDRLLVVYLDDNVGSITTIERNGGILEEVVDDPHGRLRRYRIDVDDNNDGDVTDPSPPHTAH